MKIVYLIHSLHTAGGMEKILTTKANWFCARPDTEVWIITAHLKDKKPFFPLDQRVHLLDTGVNDRIFGCRYRKRLQSFIDSIRPDMTVSLCGSDVFQLLRCSGTGARIAEYHFLHDKFFRKYPKWPLYAGIRTRRLNSALRQYDALVVLSSYDLNYYKALFNSPGNIYQIGNTLSRTSEKLSSLTQKRFICVGRLSPEKDFACAIRIWKKVSKKHPSWNLDIYGKGREKKRLEKLIRELDLSGNVNIKGTTPDILDEYANSSGLLVTSHYEGFGLVVLEAASCGIPTVTIDCPGGLTELIDNGKSGFVVPDIDAAAEKVCRLINDEDLRREMGRKAKEKLSEFSTEKIMNQWVVLFNSYIGKNGCHIQNS